MKQYCYTGKTPLALLDKTGCQFSLGFGDLVVVSRHAGTYQFGGHLFSLTIDELKESFSRFYTIEEQNRYERIHEKAMIAAMQSLITCLGDRPISNDMHEVENIPSNAIWFADNLIEKLKEKEF